MVGTAAYRDGLATNEWAGRSLVFQRFLNAMRFRQAFQDPAAAHYERRYCEARNSWKDSSSCACAKGSGWTRRSSNASSRPSAKTPRRATFRPGSCRWRAHLAHQERQDCGARCAQRGSRSAGEERGGAGALPQSSGAERLEDARPIPADPQWIVPWERRRSDSSIRRIQLYPDGALARLVAGTCAQLVVRGGVIFLAEALMSAVSPAPARVPMRMPRYSLPKRSR